MLYSVERIQEYIVPIEIHGVITRFMRDMVTQVKTNYRYRNNLAFTPWSIKPIILDRKLHLYSKRGNFCLSVCLLERVQNEFQLIFSRALTLLVSSLMTCCRYSSHSEVITRGLRVLSQSAPSTLAWCFAYQAITRQFAKSALSGGSIQVSLEFFFTLSSPPPAGGLGAQLWDLGLYFL